MNRPSLSILSLFCLITTSFVTLRAQDTAARRQQARDLVVQGNWNDALRIYEKLIADSQVTGADAAKDLEASYQCMEGLAQYKNLDALIATALQAHPRDWRVLSQAARLIGQAPHFGVLNGQTFVREQSQGFVQVDVTTYEEDRIQALQWYVQALELCGEINSDVQPVVDRGTPQARGRLWADLLTTLLTSRDAMLSWQLLLATDLQSPVDYAEAKYVNPSAPQVRPVPVDENGGPLLHALPDSWPAASSDGQRARWALKRIEELGDAETKAHALWQWVEFLDSQFSVRPLAESLLTHRDAELIADVDSLEDSETFAQLAGGIQRVQLPDPHNPIRLMQQLAKSSTTKAAPASIQLIQTYLDRKQYTKAAGIAREWLAANPAKSVEREQIESIYNSIVKPAANFRAAEPQAAGRPAKLDLAYRNATKVTFVARSVDRAALLEAIQDHAANYKQLRQIYSEFALGLSQLRSLAELDEFLSQPVATWSQDLPSDGNHAQNDIAITTPLDKGGIYVVEATVDEGSERGATKAKCLLWINDLAIVYKTLQSGTWMLVADAATGIALPNVDVEFIALNHEEAIRHQRKTNAQGVIEVAANEEVKFKFGNWFAVVRDKAGRCASTLCLNAEPYHGWMGSNDAIRTFGVTDRPVYRPGDKVRAKIRFGQVDYLNPRPLGNYSTNLRIISPQSNQVWFETVQTDAGGAIELNFDLPPQSILGVYHVNADVNRQGSILQFRVEDFRKPDFEVKIEPAKQSVRLGEAIEAKIQAKYFFGVPVSDGFVQLRVLRHAFVDRFNPFEQFAWCFGPNYPEQADEGFPTSAEFRARGYTVPTELVFDQPLKLGADGTAKIRIETAQAAKLLGQQDHEYEFVAEVRDAARRTHTATSLVTATYRPFNLYAKLSRDFYKQGENIDASFFALTVAGKAVQASGKLELLRVSKDSQGKASDELIESWNAQSDRAGRFAQRLVAGKPGQYKLRLALNSIADKSDAGSVVETVTFDVRGDGESIKDFATSQLKIVTDKREYAPGETMQLQVNSDRSDPNVWLFVRPYTSEESRPQLVKLVNGTAQMSIKVQAGDQPNFFVEAITIRDGQLVEELCEIFVPPVDKALAVKVQANKETYKPGEKVELLVDVKDANGRPATGDGLIVVYDRALEQIDPEMLPADILQNFWKRRRVYYPQTQSTLYKSVRPLFDETAPLMQPLGSLDPWQLSDELNAFYMGMSGAMSGGMPDAGGLDDMGDLSGMGGSGGMGMMGASNSREVLLNDNLRDGRPRSSTLNINRVKRVRNNFVDSAAWVSHISLNAQGRAQTSFTMPENLTDWQVRVWAVGPNMEVGSSTATISSNQELLIRLLAPRFLNERDQVTLSAIVHNQTNVEQEVKVGLEIDKSEQLGLVPGTERERNLKIAAQSEQRVEWKCAGLAAGQTAVRAKVVSATHSDAMEIKLPIQRCAFAKTDSWSGMIRPNESAAHLKIALPQQLGTEASRLTIQLNGSVSSSLLGALPYLVEYPYGCTEQTLDRFAPTVVVRHALRKMNVNVAQLKQLYESDRSSGAKSLGLAGSMRKRYDLPIFDEQKMWTMEAAGIARLAAMQNSDGGWGWYHGQSSAHATAMVLRGLLLARECGSRVEPTSIFDALEWLQRYQTTRIEQQPDPAGYLAEGGPDLDALVFHTLVMAKQKDPKAQLRLYNNRNSLSLYGKVLLALATHCLGEAEQTEMLKQNIEQFLVVDQENDTAFLRDDTQSWSWYGNRIELNALYLKLMVAAYPNSNQAAQVARYLMSNRRQAAAWESTRDTALVIEALADYWLQYREALPALQGEVLLSGKRVGTFHFDGLGLLAETQIELTGSVLTPGDHELEIRKQGAGPLFYSVYTTNLVDVQETAPAGLEIKIDRRYYRSTSITKPTALADSRSQPLPSKPLSNVRQPIDDLHALTPGTLIEVELIIESKNDYEHILIHEPRAAGMETVATKSGLIHGTKLQAYSELRDEHIEFFIEHLPQGRHVLRYQLRCESPGQFTALPAVVSAMYAPALVGNSRDNDVLIRE